MNLLFDQNLSHRLVPEILASFPDSAHVREFGLEAVGDDEVWEFAKLRHFTIVSKDADFHQRSFVHGPPPKVIWLRLGNCTTRQALDALRRHAQRIQQFDQSEESAFLVLD